MSELLSSFAPQVLLAEDDLILRRITSGMLSHLGCRVTAVPTGEAALHAFESAWDVVLLDCRAPGFDSPQTAREWRRLEESAASRRVALIALSAGGQAERASCLEAGIDDLLLLPLQPQTLRAALEKWALAANAPGTLKSSTLAETRNDSAEIECDTECETERQYAALRADYEGFEDLLHDIVRAFLSEAPAALNELRDALAAGDAARLESRAHKLKGSLLTLHAESASNVAKELEHCGSGGNLSAAPALLDALERELQRLESRLRALLSAPA